MYRVEATLECLKKSQFRNSFSLKQKELEYIEKKGLSEIRKHAYDFLRNRLVQANIPNDGKQTPMRGHPVFIAQHATATCCRGCLEKWHHIPKGREITRQELDYIVDVIMTWIKLQLQKKSVTNF